METAEKELREFDCIDCGNNTDEIHEYYMVYDKVWVSVVEGKEAGMLCIGCLEGRLGRVLKAEDFIDYPINSDSKHSDRLKNRLYNIVLVKGGNNYDKIRSGDIPHCRARQEL